MKSKCSAGGVLSLTLLTRGWRGRNRGALCGGEFRGGGSLLPLVSESGFGRDKSRPKPGIAYSLFLEFRPHVHGNFQKRRIFFAVWPFVC